MRVLLVALLFAAGDAGAATNPMLDSLKVLRTRAVKAPPAAAPSRWLEVAVGARNMLPMPADRYRFGDPPKGEANTIYDEALAHLRPIQLAALTAVLPDPRVSAAMIRTLVARKRVDEAAAECRDALGKWSLADAPMLVDACRTTRGSEYTWGGGGATHSILLQWVDFQGSSAASWAWHVGQWRGLPDEDLRRWNRTMSSGADTTWDPAISGMVFGREAIGVIVGDTSGPRGAVTQAMAGALQVPFLAIGDAPEVATPLRPGAPAGIRTIHARPGPEALARSLLAAGRRLGARRIALVLPETGGDRRLAAALARVAREIPLETVAFEYASGRQNRAVDAARLRTSGADAVALLGPGEESADWLIALRASGKSLLILGTDELDPLGFHDAARRAAEGAIYVQRDFVPNDSLPAMEFDSPAAALYVAGWVIGDAITHGADTPWTLFRAIDARAAEGDARDAWLAVPAEIARIEVRRIKGGASEVFR